MSCCQCDDHDYCCQCFESAEERAEAIIIDILDGSYGGNCPAAIGYIDSDVDGGDAAAVAIVATLKYENIL